MRERPRKLHHRPRVSLALNPGYGLRAGRVTGLHGLEAEEIEEAREIVDLAPAGWRLTAHEVEDLAVLDAVIGEPLDPSVLVEIDRDDALIDRLLHHEGDRPLGALGNIIEGLAAHGRNRRGRAEQDQHLLLACTDRDLLERPFRNDVALLVGLAETARERNAERKHGRERHAQPCGAKPARPTRLLLHSHIPLHPVPLHPTSL